MYYGGRLNSISHLIGAALALVALGSSAHFIAIIGYVR